MTAQVRTFEFCCIDQTEILNPITNITVKYGLANVNSVANGATISHSGGQQTYEIRTTPNTYTTADLYYEVVSGTGTITVTGDHSIKVIGSGLTKYRIYTVGGLGNFEFIWMVNWGDCITEIMVRFGFNNSNVVGDGSSFSIKKDMQQYSVRTNPKNPSNDQLVLTVVEGDGSITAAAQDLFSGYNPFQIRGNGIVTYRVSNTLGDVSVTWTVNWDGSSNNGSHNSLSGWLAGLTIGTTFKWLIIAAIIILACMVLSAPKGRKVKKAAAKTVKTSRKK